MPFVPACPHLPAEHQQGQRLRQLVIDPFQLMPGDPRRYEAKTDSVEWASKGDLQAQGIEHHLVEVRMHEVKFRALAGAPAVTGVARRDEVEVSLRLTWRDGFSLGQCSFLSCGAPTRFR